MHKKENMGQVELATVSFGQSFQVTPVQLAATVSSLINGGRRVTPHFGIQVRDRDGSTFKSAGIPTGGADPVRRDFGNRAGDSERRW